MTDTSGPTSGKQFAYYDHDSSSWKMWPATGLWGSIEFSATWPRTGCMSDGQAFELPTLVPPTTGNDFSSSHPPTVFSTPDTMPDAPNSGSNMRTRPPGLGNQVKTLPTPKAHDGIMGRPRTTGRPIEKSTHLGTIVTLLPTPRAANGDGRNDTVWHRPDGKPQNLENALARVPSIEKMLPTPRTTDSHGPGRHGTGGQDLRTVVAETWTGAPTAPLFDMEE